jgi:hypothetical protein
MFKLGGCMKNNLKLFLFLYAVAATPTAIWGYSIGLSDSIGCEPLKFTRRWHYVFPAHYVGCWMGEKIER